MLDLLRKRRSVRQYTRESLSEQTINSMKEALLRAPSSRNFDPWQFIFVEDRQMLRMLARSKEHGSDFLADAALGVVVCADENKSDVWVEDCSIAAILLQMTAQSLGLGSCWIQIRLRRHSAEKSSEQYIRELLGIPDNIKVLSIISIGYPDEMLDGIPSSQLKKDKIHHNRW